MGVYSQQLLTIRGPEAAMRAFREACLDLDETGFFLGFRRETIAPCPDGLPDGWSAGELGNDVDVGVELLLRTPAAAVRTPYGRDGVLQTSRARKLGLTDYDILHAWALRHRPQLLEVGAAAIRAHATTGYWSRRDYDDETWGSPLCDGFQTLEVDAAEEIAARFHSSGEPVGAMVRTMGAAFPGLDFRLAALCEDAPYLARCAGGIFAVAEDVDVTDAFVAEVEGEPREYDAAYDEPSRLVAEPWRKVRSLSAQRRLDAAMLDYPVYRSPYPGLPAKLRPAEADANLEHFLATRSARLARLKNLLRNFDVELERSEAGLAALDGWIERYGAALRLPETVDALLTAEPEWSGGFAGRNVILDLATHLGEHAIARHPELKWGLSIESAAGLRSSSEWHQTIGLRCDDTIWGVDVIGHTDLVCAALRSRTYLLRRPRVHLDDEDAVRRATSRFMQGVTHSLHLKHQIAR